MRAQTNDVASPAVEVAGDVTLARSAFGRTNAKYTAENAPER